MTHAGKISAAAAEKKAKEEYRKYKELQSVELSRGEKDYIAALESAEDVYKRQHLTIPNVVKEYERLIAQKRFPGEDAIAKIPESERRQVARAIYSSLYNACLLYTSVLFLSVLLHSVFPRS